MRVLTIAILACGIVTSAAAQQKLKVEVFDRSGLPARAQTDAERELIRRTTQHRTGDVADAVQIQRMLATYYRGQGDETRARAAEERARASASQMETSIGRPPAVPMYQPEAGAAAETTPSTPIMEPLGGPAAPPEPVTGISGTVPYRPSGRYYGVRGNTMHSWEFRADGTFEHTWADNRSGTVPQIEAGKYSMTGNMLTLFIARTPFGTGAANATRRMRIDTRGPAARDGLMLDGMPLSSKAP